MTTPPPPGHDLLDHGFMRGQAGAPWRQALELLEAGRYFESHEVLERVWLHTQGLRRELYGGVILMAAMLHKSRVQHAPAIARRLYERARIHLARVPDRALGLHVREFERRCLAALHDDHAVLCIPRMDEEAHQLAVPPLNEPQ